MKTKIVKALFKILAGDVVNFKKFKEDKAREPEADPMKFTMQKNLQNKQRLKEEREKANEKVKRAYRLKETSKAPDFPSWLKSKKPQVELACVGGESLLFDTRTKYFYLETLPGGAKVASKKSLTKKQVIEWLDKYEDDDDMYDEEAELFACDKVNEINKLFFGNSSSFA